MAGGDWNQDDLDAFWQNTPEAINLLAEYHYLFGEASELSEAPKWIKSKETFMLEACRVSQGKASKYAARSLLRKPSFIGQLVSWWTEASARRWDMWDMSFLRHIGCLPETKQRQAILVALQQDGLALQYAAAGVRADRPLVLVALRRNGLALQYASAGLRADRQVVLVALDQNGRALQYATDALRGAPDIVEAAITQTGSALQYASIEVFGRRQIVISALLPQQNRYSGGGGCVWGCAWGTRR